METLTWVGIIFCVSQSAMFSGLNLAFFSVTKLRLEIESKKGNPQALKVAELREDSIIIRDDHKTLGEVIPKLKVQPERSDDDVIDEDIILFWGSQKRIITGSDILGRLMRGIVQNEGIGFRKLVLKEA